LYAIANPTKDGWALVTKGRRTNPFPTTPSPATTAIANSGASDFYLTPAAPVINITQPLSAAKVTVGDAAGSKHRSSSAQANIQLDLPIRNAKIMPSYSNII
jgi:hypothetical protein